MEITMLYLYKNNPDENVVEILSLDVKDKVNGFFLFHKFIHTANNNILFIRKLKENKL